MTINFSESNCSWPHYWQHCLQNCCCNQGIPGPRGTPGIAYAIISFASGKKHLQSTADNVDVMKHANLLLVIYSKQTETGSANNMFGTLNASL